MEFSDGINGNKEAEDDLSAKLRRVEATARLVEQCLLEAHALLHRPTYTDKQKEMLARYLASGLASGPADKVHKVDIDKWIADVSDAFDMIENMN